MKGMIKIENLTGRHLQYRIDHQQVCVKIGRCLCRKGRRSMEALTVHVPGRGMTAPIFAGVAQSPEIRADANGKRPKIKIHGYDAEADAKAAISASAKEQGQTEGSRTDDDDGKRSSTGRKGQTAGKGKATT